MGNPWPPDRSQHGCTVGVDWDPPRQGGESSERQLVQCCRGVVVVACERRLRRALFRHAEEVGYSNSSSHTLQEGEQQARWNPLQMNARQNLRAFGEQMNPRDCV